jgi:hypothetical protein
MVGGVFDDTNDVLVSSSRFCWLGTPARGMLLWASTETPMFRPMLFEEKLQ